jgi:hypothetical protein
MSLISNTIKNILSHGIALNLESEEEEQYYISQMQEYFEDKTDFTSYLRGNNVIEVEADNMELAMEIVVQDSTLYMVPYVPDVFSIFTEILKFIAEQHTNVLSDFRGEETSEIHSISELNIEEEMSEEEESSSDDLEWI